MTEINMHRIETIKATKSIKSELECGHVFHRRTFTFTDWQGSDLTITLYADNKDKLKTIVTKE